LILLFALLAGGAVGWGVARWQKCPWQFPSLKHIWLVIVAFLPQLIAIYLPTIRYRISDGWAAASLVASQVFLLAFCWFNRRIPGMVVLAGGLAANLLVIAINGGFMPISPETASRLVTAETLQSVEIGSRFGWKDILLLPEHTNLAFLSDQFLLPKWFPYQVAFSVGDILVAAGAFWVMVAGSHHSQKES
jgi:Family of unknown function (DUF5317)